MASLEEETSDIDSKISVHQAAFWTVPEHSFRKSCKTFIFFNDIVIKFGVKYVISIRLWFDTISNSLQWVLTSVPVTVIASICNCLVKSLECYF